MKKLILSIAAVFLLQTAYIVFTMVRTVPDVAAISISSRSSVDPVNWDVYDATDDLSTAVEAVVPVRVHARPPVSQIPEPPRQIVASRRRSPAKPLPLERDQRVIFKNEYAAVTVGPVSDEAETKNSEPNRAEKRSSSTFVTVIKKPYELVKAIGSKFR